MDRANPQETAHGVTKTVQEDKVPPALWEHRSEWAVISAWGHSHGRRHFSGPSERKRIDEIEKRGNERQGIES